MRWHKGTYNTNGFSVPKVECHADLEWYSIEPCYRDSNSRLHPWALLSFTQHGNLHNGHVHSCCWARTEKSTIVNHTMNHTSTNSFTWFNHHVYIQKLFHISHLSTLTLFRLEKQPKCHQDKETNSDTIFICYIRRI